MGWFTSLFSAQEMIGKTVDLLGAAVDKGVYTAEEKQDAVKSLYDQFTPRALTRRILAVIIYANFFLHINVYLACNAFHFDLPAMDQVIELEGKLTLTVTIFYFGYYGLKQIFTKVKK